MIEYTWRLKVQYYLKHKRKAFRETGKIKPCSSTVALEVYQNGTYKSLEIKNSCVIDAELDSIVIESWRAIEALPPVPKNLIRNEVLLIEWVFEVR